MIAGLTMQEALSSAPGFVMDMYYYRQAYDDEQHGIRRVKPWDRSERG